MIPYHQFACAENSVEGAVAPAAGRLPDQLDQMLRCYMPSRCLLTALELDVFTAVDGGATAEQAAVAIKASRRGTEALLNALVALGLLAKQEDRYHNTAETQRYFADGSKEGHRYGLIHIAHMWHRWSSLTEAVRMGVCPPSARADIIPEWTEQFIAGMQYNAQGRAPLVVAAVGTAGVRRILDLGGGSGIYSIAFAKASPEVRSQILDLAQVVPLTAGYVERAGVSAQVSVRAGDMLEDDLGTGYDLVMLNAICHMFSAEQIQRLFGRIRRALAPGGRLVVQDFILDPDKTSPLQAALFSVNMLVGTEAGASYTEAEFTAWMTSAGLIDVRRIHLPGPSDLIVGTAPGDSAGLAR